MVSDVFQWKKSSHKSSALGLGFKFSNLTRDVDRGVDHSRDQLNRLVHDPMLNRLEGMVTIYDNHFNSGITITHRATIRGLADDLYDRAKNHLRNDYAMNDQNIVDAERLLLERRLCELENELNANAGSTRNCFSGHVKARTLADNSIQTTALLAKLKNDAISAETDAMHNAHDRSYQAYIVADDLDFTKYLNSFMALKGMWNKLDFTDRVDENIHETVAEITSTVQWNRQAGSIADGAGLYDGDQAAIDAAGGAFS